jgi:glycosyltransferase involved in cell wall biosynthesis
MSAGKLMINTLVISTELPLTPMTGGPMRTYQLARALAQLGQVTIAGFILEDQPVPEFAPPLRAVGVPWEPPPLYAQMESADERLSRHAYEVLGEQVAEPWIVSCYHSERLRQVVHRLCVTDIDLVVVEHSLMGAYLEMVPRHIPAVLDLHNVHWREAERAVQRGLEQASERDRVRDYERALIKRCALTIVVSEIEAAVAHLLSPDACIEVVPNGVDTAFYTPAGTPPAPGYVLFTGLMNYAPNVEAVTWFSREVLPLIDGATLHVVGSSPAEAVESLASGSFVVHGQVPDTRPYQSQASVVVVPLLSGAGTRLKILEAAACGNAIVSTTLGAEGLDLRPGRDLLVADSPAEFAQAVSAVLSDDELRARLGHNARRVSEEYAWELIGERLIGIVGLLLEAGRSHRRRAATHAPAREA